MNFVFVSAAVLSFIALWWILKTIFVQLQRKREVNFARKYFRALREYGRQQRRKSVYKNDMV